jgi:hypothetical protein
VVRVGLVVEGRDLGASATAVERLRFLEGAIGLEPQRDVSELGEGWSDSRIAAALDTSIATIERTRRQLVEEGFEAVLRRKYNPNSARPRIFDGAAEAKLIALTLSPASPKGGRLNSTQPTTMTTLTILTSQGAMW